MMTFMFGFFTLQVPYLSLYWVTSNLLQMLQQWLITDARFGLAPATVSAGGGALVDAAPAERQRLVARAAVASDEPAPAAAKPRTPKRRRAKRR